MCVQLADPPGGRLSISGFGEKASRFRPFAPAGRRNLPAPNGEPVSRGESYFRIFFVFDLDPAPTARLTSPCGKGGTIVMRESCIAEALRPPYPAEALAERVGRGVVRSWREEGIRRLLPIQTRALRESVAAPDENLLVCAPTSAGKTLVAEIEIAAALRAGRKAMALVPTRALAERLAARFARRFGPEGRCVVLATRDRPEADELVLGDRFDVVVGVFEKANRYAILRPEIFAATGVVVLDEVQTLGDPERGPALDLLATKLLLSPYRTRIVALSATLSERDADAAAAWLGARRVSDESRPRPLREGIFDATTGRFRYRDAASGEEGEEAAVPPEAFAREVRAARAALEEAGGRCERGVAPLLALAARLAREESALVFAPTRAAARIWAETLASLGAGDPADDAGRRIVEPFGSVGSPERALRRCMQRGVGFHGADLDEDARAAVEEAFDRGDLRAVVSTPTLASGVDLSCRNALHYPVRLGTDAESGRPVRLPLGRARFANQGGRAARLGFGEGFGRSIVVATSPAEAERLWETLVRAPFEPLDLPDLARGLPRAALDLLAGRTGRTPENLAEAVGRTFAARAATRRAGSGDGGAAVPAPAIDAAIARCRRAGLVETDEDGLARCTGIGEIAAAAGVSVATAEALAKLARDRTLEEGVRSRTGVGCGGAAVAGEPVFDGDAAFRVCRAIALSEDGRRAAAGFARGGGASSRTVGSEPRGGGARRDERAAARVAAMLGDWTGEVSGEEFEERWEVSLGGFARVAADFQWLIGTAGAFAEATGAPAGVRRALGNLAALTGAGLGPTGLKLARMRLPGVGREGMRALLREGIDSEEALRATAPARLAELVGERAARRLSASEEADDAERKDGNEERDGKDEKHGSARNDNKNAPDSSASFQSSSSLPSFPSFPSSPSPSPPSIPSPSPSPSSSPSHLLEIDLRSPGIVRAAGREVRLTPKAFDLLAALAERPGQVVTREALYRRLWPEGGAEDQQLDSHRRGLLARLRPALGDRAPAVAEVVRGIGFRCNLPPGRVQCERG